MGNSAAKSILTPDEALATKIADAIKAAGLMSEQKLTRLRGDLAKGTLSAADWRLLAELALPDKGGTSL
jgi:hypothetical protein